MAVEEVRESDHAAAGFDSTAVFGSKDTNRMIDQIGAARSIIHTRRAAEAALDTTHDPDTTSEEQRSEYRDDDTCNGTESDNQVPIEMQCEQFDMTDPKMDLLEWTARTVIPIPRAYYWETGNHGVPIRIRAWHRLVAAMESMVRTVDRMGDPVVNMTGLTASRYAYVVSTMSDRQLDIAKATASERKQRNHARLEALRAEEGALVSS